MPTQSRTAASGRNLCASLLGQVLTIAVNLISRRIFIRLLGSEYAGFSGLCGHLLNLLSVLEPGFDAACAFMLYKPLALGDGILVSQICRYLKCVYRKVSVATFLVGVLFLPLALHFSGEDIDSAAVTTIWLLSVAEASLGYLLSHRRILPIADQKGYVITTYGYVFFIVSQSLRLIALVKTGSHIAYLLAGILTGLLEEILLYRKIGRMYRCLGVSLFPLAPSVQSEIRRNAAALLLHKIGTILCGSVDNMAVFLFLGLSGGATYSNYTMLLGSCLSLVGGACGAISASVGNLGVTEKRERVHRVYSAAFFSVVMIACLLSLSLYFTYPLIIRAWMGEEMVLGSAETLLFSVSLFVSALRRPTAVFLDAAGLFEREKYKTVIEAAISCTVTLALAPRLGIVGVLTGQIFAAVSFSLWFEPYLLYKYGFFESFRTFLSKALGYIFACTLSAILGGVLVSAIPDRALSLPAAILLRLLACLFSVTTVFGIMFFDKHQLRDSVRYAIRLCR